MSVDPGPAEHAYADGLLDELARDGRAVIQRADVVGSYPETTFVVVFRVGDRPCIFGVRDRIWDEEDPTTFDTARSVTYAWLRWEEALDTDELPNQCDPDGEGVTWLNLWDDW